ncbi:uncharacterized protein LOC120124518 [Hibiscus syriacus]|uniref:uncharacterized protein LOC120124518 n=1 Tax=Hibiscus syriacus TaxID=106335 RepID=UPI001921D5B2|nr:uncharacterized protein LOC120124518 [Hibiscus syriacus]
MEFFFVQITPLAGDEVQQEPDKPLALTNWWGETKTRFTAMAMVVTPTLLVSTNSSRCLLAATDIAVSSITHLNPHLDAIFLFIPKVLGCRTSSRGYCMTMLYGVSSTSNGLGHGNQRR